MHAKPDLRVFLKWMIAHSGSVITGVILLSSFQAKKQMKFSIGNLFLVVVVSATILAWRIDRLKLGRIQADYEHRLTHLSASVNVLKHRHLYRSESRSSELRIREILSGRQLQYSKTQTVLDVLSAFRHSGGIEDEALLNSFVWSAMAQLDCETVSDLRRYLEEHCIDLGVIYDSTNQDYQRFETFIERAMATQRADAG